jgi:xanthine dehydrogenase YagR molybdenum-binding subunit
MVLGIPPEKIKVVSQFVGGGFGGKAYVWPHTLMAAVAAKAIDRPVRMQLTRAQSKSLKGHKTRARLFSDAAGWGVPGLLRTLETR